LAGFRFDWELRLTVAVDSEELKCTAHGFTPRLLVLPRTQVEDEGNQSIGQQVVVRQEEIAAIVHRAGSGDFLEFHSGQLLHPVLDVGVEEVVELCKMWSLDIHQVRRLVEFIEIHLLSRPIHRLHFSHQLWDDRFVGEEVVHDSHKERVIHQIHVLAFELPVFRKIVVEIFNLMTQTSIKFDRR
jgi:hypothetical protein